MTLLVWMMILVPFALACAEALSARIDRLAERELRRLLRHAATRRRMAWRVAIADMAGELVRLAGRHWRVALMRRAARRRREQRTNRRLSVHVPNDR